MRRFFARVGDGVEGFLRWQVGVGLALSLAALAVIANGSPSGCGRRTERWKVRRAVSDLQFIANRVRTFGVDQGRLPARLSELVDRPADAKVWPEGGYLERSPMDPWGEPYQVRVPGRRGGDFDVASLGEDNLPGGSGADSDLDQGSRSP